MALNWATIEPKTRIYKGKNLFRWEDSPGLEHHCGTCATPLHNSRAKSTCIGKHVEPCYRFHQQLHFVGKSHECFGCNSSDSLHHIRHKEILTIVRQINASDHAGATLLVGSPLVNKNDKRRASTNTHITDTSSEAPSASTDSPAMTRKERKKAKKIGNAGVKNKTGLAESFPKEEIDFISQCIHLTIHECKGGVQGTYVYEHSKKNPEGEESAIVDEEESVQGQDQYDELDTVADRLHNLAVRAPQEMTPRQRKVVKKFSTPVNHQSFHGGSKKYSPISPFQKEDLYDGVDPKIFFRLNIEVVKPVNKSKARKELVTKLVAAIKEDIEIIEREDEETAMREEGFRRWAGKSAWEAILKVREKWDWATGQKKEVPQYDPLADDADLDLGELEDPGTPITEPDSEASPIPDIKIHDDASGNYTFNTDTWYESDKETPIIEEVWETVGSAKKNKTNTPKTPVTKSTPEKFINARKVLGHERNKLSFVREESEEDAGNMDEMVRRFKQKAAGKMTIGVGKEDLGTPTRKPSGGGPGGAGKGRGLTLSIK